MNRKKFLLTLAGSGGLMVSPIFAQSEPKPSLPAEKVKEFVGVFNRDLDLAKALLLEFPNLIYSSWDWGGGDFESGIEAAGHVGRKDIANFLLEKGARTNIFLLTMLGKTQIIKDYLNLFPEHINMRGPHGFSLLHHANRGGEEASQLARYLVERGLSETKFTL